MTASDLRAWAAENNLMTRTQWPKIKRELYKQFDVDYDALREREQRERAEKLAAAAASAPVVSLASAGDERGSFAVVGDADTSDVAWYGSFHKDDRIFRPGDQDSADEASAGKAVFLAAKVRDHLEVEAVRLRLRVSSERIDGGVKLADLAAKKAGHSRSRGDADRQSGRAVVPRTGLRRMAGDPPVGSGGGRMIRRLALIGVLAGALTVAGCSSETDQDQSTTNSSAQPSSTEAWPPTEPAAPIEQSTPPVPAAPSVDTSDPGELGRTVVETWFSYDTRTDTNRNDAPVRAADLGVLTGELDAQVRADVQIPVKASGEWAQWASQGATVTAVAVEVPPNQGQANTATKYHGMYEVTSTVTDSSGTEIGTDVQYVAVVLTDNGDGWRVSSVTTL